LIIRITAQEPHGSGKISQSKEGRSGGRKRGKDCLVAGSLTKSTSAVEYNSGPERPKKAVATGGGGRRGWGGGKSKPKERGSKIIVINNKKNPLSKKRGTNTAQGREL